jgi:NAD+ diphosphatase
LGQLALAYPIAAARHWRFRVLIGVYPFEQMNQVIIAYHVPANGAVALNHELDDFRHVRLGECKAWPGGTGLALRDWLRSKGFEPPMLELR